LLNIKRWRLFELKNEKLYTLFHAFSVNGGRKSREVPIGKWIDAEIKEVYDGSKSKKYISGFHVFDDINYGLNFKNKFRKPRNLVLVAIEIRGNVRKKPTNNNVLLVDSMYIPNDFRENMIFVMKG